MTIHKPQKAAKQKTKKIKIGEENSIPISTPNNCNKQYDQNWWDLPENVDASERDEERNEQWSSWEEAEAEVEELRENGLRLEPVRRESEAEGTLILSLEAGRHKRDEAEATTEVDKEAIEIFYFLSPSQFFFFFLQ